LLIGERVHKLLLEQGKMQKDLADYLNTRPSTVNGWKQGNRTPSTEMLIPISEFLGVSVEYLITGKESERKEIILSDEDSEWLTIIHKLPRSAQTEFKAEMKGYLKAYYEKINGLNRK